jgi:ABC-2 type transport system ATP-binding protein
VEAPPRDLHPESARAPTTRTRFVHTVGTVNSSDIAIDVRDLRMSYGRVEAVRGLDISVARGEIFAFLGPNGAGKTSTVEILEGFRSRTAGSVSVLGEDPQAATSAWRDRIGIVLQESEPEPGLSVRESLELYAGYYARPRAIDDTIELIGLAQVAETLAIELSGGQRRRLDFGLALVGDPDLIFLDEPTTGFDPSARRAAWDVIDGLRALGKTIFLTTHYMDEAERLADRIAVIVAGRIVAEGTPETLGGRDRAGVTIGFTAPERTASLPPPFADAIQGGHVSLRTTTALRDLAALAQWAERAGVDLPDLSVARPTLEDIYLDLTSTTRKAEAA